MTSLFQMYASYNNIFGLSGPGDGTPPTAPVFEATSQFLAPTGTISSPGYSFSDEKTLGIERSGTGTMALVGDGDVIMTASTGEVDLKVPLYLPDSQAFSQGASILFDGGSSAYFSGEYANYGGAGTFDTLELGITASSNNIMIQADITDETQSGISLQAGDQNTQSCVALWGTTVALYGFDNGGTAPTPDSEIYSLSSDDQSYAGLLITESGFSVTQMGGIPRTIATRVSGTGMMDTTTVSSPVSGTKYPLSLPTLSNSYPDNTGTISFVSNNLNIHKVAYGIYRISGNILYSVSSTPASSYYRLYVGTAYDVANNLINYNQIDRVPSGTTSKMQSFDVYSIYGGQSSSSVPIQFWFMCEATGAISISVDGVLLKVDRQLFPSYT